MAEMTATDFSYVACIKTSKVMIKLVSINTEREKEKEEKETFAENM